MSKSKIRVGLLVSTALTASSFALSAFAQNAPANGIDDSVGRCIRCAAFAHHVSEECAGEKCEHEIDETEAAFNQMSIRKSEIANEGDDDGKQHECRRQRPFQCNVKNNEQRNRDAENYSRMKPERHVTPQCARYQFGLFLAEP